jgi:hypothetical protein
MEYRELLETSMQYLRCPICSAADDLEFDQLSKLQYEVTVDAKLRQQIASNGGFCTLHFRRFRKLADSQTNALMLQTLYEEWQRDKNLQFGSRCIVCKENEMHEKNLLTSFASSLYDENFYERFQASAGLCFEHQQEVSQLLQEPSKAVQLGQLHEEQLEKLMHTVEKMINAGYFETRDLERRSIPCVIEKFVGRKALGL